MKDICSFCGTSYQEIQETGFVGCENCYREIDGLKAYVQSLYGNAKYRGKDGGNGGF